MRTVEEQVEIIRRAGHRVTRSRRAVLQVLAGAEHALDPTVIHSQGRRIHSRLGRVSVYRTLDLLAELGLVRQVHGEGGCHGYARAECSEGHYLICQQCGQVTEFPCEGLDLLIEAVGRQYGFQVQEHMLQLEGICSDCRRID